MARLSSRPRTTRLGGARFIARRAISHRARRSSYRRRRASVERWRMGQYKRLARCGGCRFVRLALHRLRRQVAFAQEFVGGTMRRCLVLLSLRRFRPVPGHKFVLANRPLVPRLLTGRRSGSLARGRCLPEGTCRLTAPSRRRPPASFACFRPRLMSNVRPHGPLPGLWSTHSSVSSSAGTRSSSVLRLQGAVPRGYAAPARVDLASDQPAALGSLRRVRQARTNGARLVGSHRVGLS
jgi:hypothetical protein